MCYRMRGAARLFAAALLIIFACPAGAAPFPAATLWRDDFEDGTTEGWVVGQTSPNQPENVSSGGPGGPSDNFLRLRSSGDPNMPGGRMIALNRNRLWTQNLYARNVRRIEMDVKVFESPVPMQMRLAFYSLGPNGFASTVPAVVPNDGQWHHITLPMTAETMTQLGSIPFHRFFEDFEEIRIMHTSTVNLRADPVRAIVGIDNVTVVAPEPGAFAIAIGGAFMLLRRRR